MHHIGVGTHTFLSEEKQHWLELLGLRLATAGTDRNQAIN
jgi:hypothetical protein